MQIAQRSSPAVELLIFNMMVKAHLHIEFIKLDRVVGSARGVAAWPNTTLRTHSLT